MSEISHQVILYTSYLHIIGGIETFVLNFIKLMGADYDIALVCPKLPPEMEKKLSPLVKIYKNNERITCDTLVMIRMMDRKPYNVSYKKSVRMCHACKSNPSWRVELDCDKIVHVSKASRDSFDTGGEVILNPLMKTDKKALLFVSATRIPAIDKGQNADRMLQLAQMLNNTDIPFLWFNFSDQPLRNAPKGLINVGAYQDLQPYIARADYLVQLSDQEGFGYSVAEALLNNTAVLCTPFETTKELGVIDGKNGYIVPFDLGFDVRKLLNVPMFEYSYDNEALRKKWRKIFDAKPRKRKGQNAMVEVRVKHPYLDLALNKHLSPNQILLMTRERAEEVASKGYIEIVGGVR